MNDESEIECFETQFHVGQIVHHRLFDYRGVIVQADSRFRLSDEWYENMARTSPPKDRPWYRVLVHGGDEVTYVAERNLEPDPSADPVLHPHLSRYFNAFENGYYWDQSAVN